MLDSATSPHVLLTAGAPAPVDDTYRELDRRSDEFAAKLNKPPAVVEFH